MAKSKVIWYFHGDSNWMKTCMSEHMITQIVNVHGAIMAPTWVLSAPDGPHFGPMNLAMRRHCHNMMTSWRWHPFWITGPLCRGSLVQAMAHRLFSAKTSYLNRWCLNVNWIPRNKHHWNWITINFIEETKIESIVLQNVSSFVQASMCHPVMSGIQHGGLTHCGRDKMAATLTDDTFKYKFVNENI